nr:hypothetical protein L204_04201 [Cryptococcus depauperatus CBS 7855]
MEVDAVRHRRGPLPFEEKEYRRTHNLCAYCGKGGHDVESCRAKPKFNYQQPFRVNAATTIPSETTDTEDSKNAGSQAYQSMQSILPQSSQPYTATSSELLSEPTEHLCFPITIQYNRKSYETYAMLDSGATNNFINSTFLAETNIQKIKKKNPLQLQVIDGRPIKSGAVTHNTCPIQLLIQDHKEAVSFDITTLGDYPVILGLPWLSQHNPSVRNGSIPPQGHDTPTPS